MKAIDKKSISNIRILTMEMITNAQSGHPGIALGAAPIMHTLYTKVLKKNPYDSTWFNRDRFVLAAGHGSSLLYAILHLSGYQVKLTDLKEFRKIGSLTPGHPEYHYTDGVDATSGPLGQGIPMAVGMAISEEYLRHKYNKDIDLIDYYTFVLCGDGDLQEGVTAEALSIAGHLQLNKLIILYDSNDIQLDGEVKKCNTENVKERFKALGFNYLRVNDGENCDDLLKKINLAKASDKPTLIEIKTIIGKTSSKENTSKVHGSPLAALEVEEMRKAFGGKQFEVKRSVYNYYKEVKEANLLVYNYHKEQEKLYQEKYPLEYLEFKNLLAGRKEISRSDLNLEFDPNYSKATRYVSGEVMKILSNIDKGMLGGSADLVASTSISGNDGDFTAINRTGRNIRFGVREHAMAAICNGITLNGATRGFCSGFFVFSDYLKPAMRMASLMGLPVIYIFSHDSIAVGEDGPTHQPIEQLTMVRSIPNMNVIRPCGREETIEALLVAYNSKNNPTCVITSRQNILESRNSLSNENLVAKGAYIIGKEINKLDAIILASGSEVRLAMDAKKVLFEQGIDVRVVSIPSFYLFDKQKEEYILEVLPKDKFILGLEMSDATHFYKYLNGGKLLNISEFGMSGKASDVINHFGFTVENVVKTIKENI